MAGIFYLVLRLESPLMVYSTNNIVCVFHGFISAKKAFFPVIFQDYRERLLPPSTGNTGGEKKAFFPRFSEISHKIL